MATTDELQKIRLDLAWKHFDFHAKQRTTMFQYFSGVVPLIVGGYFYFLKEQPAAYVTETLVIVALLGMMLSIGFWLLEMRNRQLISASELNICLLEEAYLYPEATNYKARENPPGGYDLSVAGATKEGVKAFRGIFHEVQCGPPVARGWGQFRTVMKFMYGGSTGLFFLLVLYAIACRNEWGGFYLR